jgi:hypothetical protein
VARAARTATGKLCGSRSSICRGQSELLVLHDPVIELESAGPEQQAAPPPLRDEAAPAVRIGQQEKTGDHRDEPQDS